MKHPLSGSCSVFGLSQNEYVKDSNAKIFLYEDFDNVLDYIDKIFQKSIPRLNKLNKRHLTPLVNSFIQKKIESVFKEDYFLHRWHLKRRPNPNIF